MRVFILCLIFIFIVSISYAVIVTKETEFEKPAEDLQIQKIVEALQGRISFLDTSEGIGDGRHSQNLDGEFQKFTSNAVADTEETISHGLDRIPKGFIVVDADKSANLYKGTTAWTSSNIYLKSNTASTTFTILIF